MKSSTLLAAWLGTVLVIGSTPWCLGQDRISDRQRTENQSDLQRRDARQRMGGLQDSRIVPPYPDRHRRWRLGVEVTYTQYGALITSVERRSPASRAGLEARDVIVTVNGFQVGHVNNLLYTLDRELDFRADRRGMVRLLVQNRRNSRLEVLPVRLEPADRPVPPPRVRPLTGTVTSRSMTQLPRAAVLEIRLLDVTDRRSLQNLVVRKTLRNLGPFPIPFELEYDPEQIDPGRAYALEAQVLVDGLVTLRTRTRHPVLQKDRHERVHMTLERLR